MKIYPERKTMKSMEENSVACSVLYRSALVVLTPSSMVGRVTMDLFEHRYYRLSKILMMLIGQWPYQSTRTKRGILSILIIVPGSAIVPEVLAVMKYRHDETMLLECFILNVAGTICGVKLFSFILHSQPRSSLISLIRTDWQVWARDREVNILHDYAEQGQKIAVVYTATIYSSFFICMTQPLIPTIVDVLLKNGTASREFPYPVVYYNIDEQKYFFHLVTYSNICVCMILTVLISNDVILVIYVQHVCGIFAALGHKLRRIGADEKSVERGESPRTLDKKDMAHLAWCITRHNDAIEYANLIEASYTRTFFITYGLGMILINVVGLQVLMRSSDFTTAARYIFFIFTIMFYFYIECHVSQRLVDHSIGIRYCIYNSEWYRLTPKAQKILQLMTIRSTVPCYLTAGKIMVLSVRTFWLSFKTAVSYFGFLRSTQGL